VSRLLTLLRNALGKIVRRRPGRPFWAGRSPAWLWLVVVLQLAIPASYYLRGTDPEDERFAWRMFSDVRLRRCELVAEETVAGKQRSIVLERELHASWLGALRRGRKPVIDRFLKRHCVHHPVAAVLLVRRCSEVDGQTLPERRYRLDCTAESLAVSSELR
jgi:hypothetical protein